MAYSAVVATARKRRRWLMGSNLQAGLCFHDEHATDIVVGQSYEHESRRGKASLTCLKSPRD